MKTLCIFVLCLMAPMALTTYYNNIPMYAQPMTSTALIQSARPRPTYPYAKRRFAQNLPTIIFLKHLMELDCLKEIFNEGRQKNLNGFLMNEFNSRTNAGGYHQMSRVIHPEELRKNSYPTYLATQRPRTQLEPEEAEVKFLGNKRPFIENPGGKEDFNATQSEEESKLSKGYHSEGGEKANEKPDPKDEKISHGEDYVIEGSRNYPQKYPQVEETGETEEKVNEVSTTKSGTRDDYFFPMMVSFGDDKQFSKFSQQPGGKAPNSPHPENVLYHLRQSKKPILIRPYEVEEIMEKKLKVDLNKEKLDSGKDLEFRGRKIFKIGNKKNPEEKVKITFSVKGEKKEENKVPEALIDKSFNKILRGLITPSDKFHEETEQVKEKGTEKKFALAKNASPSKNEAIWGGSEAPLPRKFLSYNFYKEKTRKDDVPKGYQGVFNRYRQPPDASVKPLTTMSGYQNFFTISKETSKPTTETQIKLKTSSTPSLFLKVPPKFHVLQVSKQKSASNFFGPEQPSQNTTFGFLEPKQNSAFSINIIKDSRPNPTIQVVENSRQKPTYNFPVQEDPKQKFIFNENIHLKQKTPSNFHLTENLTQNTTFKFHIAEGPRQTTSAGDPRKKTEKPNTLGWENLTQKTTAKFQVSEISRQTATTSKFLMTEGPREKSNIFEPEVPRPKILASEDLRQTFKFEKSENPKLGTNLYLSEGPKLKTSATSPGVLVDYLDLNFSNLLKHLVNQQDEGKHDESFVPVIGRQTTTSKPQISSSTPSLLTTFIISTKAEVKDDVFFTSTKENLLTSQPPFPSEFLTTTIKNDSTTQNFVTNFTTSQYLTTSNDGFTLGASTPAAIFNISENMVLEEAAWKNSRKMHFEQESQKNETSEIFEPRRSDILITDNLEEYEDHNQDTAKSFVDFLRKNGTSLASGPLINLTYPSIVSFIPVVINDLRDNKISTEDNEVLSEYFGKYWPYILSLSNNTQLDLLPLIKMKDEKDLENVLRSFVPESSEVNSTTVEPASLQNSESYEDDDYGYDYMDDYRDMYRDILGQELDIDLKKRFRGKRDDEEAEKRSEAMREYFESIEEERVDEGNDYIFEDITYDTTLEDIEDLNLLDLANLQVNITSWGS